MPSLPNDRFGPAADRFGGAQTQAGAARGEGAMVHMAASVLSDAAEEVGMHLSHKVEEKEFEEREIEVDHPLNLMAPEDIEAYLDAARAFRDPEELVALAKRMLASGNPSQQARQMGDVTQQFLVLQYALQLGEENGSPPEVLDQLRDALADLELESGPRIRAGLNTIDAASQYSTSAEGVISFQNAYRDIVLGEAVLIKTLNLMLDRFGQGDFAKGLQTLMRALGSDLSASRPSTDRSRLQALVQDLYQLEVTSTILESCKRLLDRMTSRYGAKEGDPVDMLKEMVAITNEKWVAAGRFGAMTERMELALLRAQIEFMTGIHAMMRRIPVKIFPDPDTRFQILDAAQEALDVLIDNEDNDGQVTDDDEDENAEDGDGKNNDGAGAPAGIRPRKDAQ